MIQPMLIGLGLALSELCAWQVSYECPYAPDLTAKQFYLDPPACLIR